MIRWKSNFLSFCLHLTFFFGIVSFQVDFHAKNSRILKCCIFPSNCNACYDFSKKKIVNFLKLGFSRFSGFFCQNLLWSLNNRRITHFHDFFVKILYIFSKSTKCYGKNKFATSIFCRQNRSSISEKSNWWEFCLLKSRTQKLRKNAWFA